MTQFQTIRLKDWDFKGRNIGKLYLQVFAPVAESTDEAMFLTK